MKKIEITKENYEAYKEFMPLVDKNGHSKKYNLVPICIWFATCVAVFVSGVTITNGLITFLTMCTIGGIGIYTHENLPHLLSIRDFKKKYPDFDINVDINIEELEKELVKYEELSVIPKDIEIQKEEHLSIDNNNFKEMSPEEKIAFLEQEKEFWKQVQTQEKYSVSNNNKKEVQKTRKIEF